MQWFIKIPVTWIWFFRNLKYNKGWCQSSWIWTSALRSSRLTFRFPVQLWFRHTPSPPSACPARPLTYRDICLRRIKEKSWPPSHQPEVIIGAKVHCKWHKVRTKNLSIDRAKSFMNLSSLIYSKSLPTISFLFYFFFFSFRGSATDETGPRWHSPMHELPSSGVVWPWLWWKSEQSVQSLFKTAQEETVVTCAVPGQAMLCLIAVSHACKI